MKDEWKTCIMVKNVVSIVGSYFVYKDWYHQFFRLQSSLGYPNRSVPGLIRISKIFG